MAIDTLLPQDRKKLALVFALAIENGYSVMDSCKVNLIRLPTASAMPILQNPSRGRRPKSIISLREFQRRKARREADKSLIDEEIEMLKKLTYIETQKAGPWRAYRLRLLTEPCITSTEKVEFKKLLDDLRYAALPFEVRQSIDADRLGRGKVLLFETR